MSCKHGLWVMDEAALADMGLQPVEADCIAIAFQASLSPFSRCAVVQCSSQEELQFIVSFAKSLAMVYSNIKSTFDINPTGKSGESKHKLGLFFGCLKLLTHCFLIISSLMPRYGRATINVE